jgi:Tol biopolymer transport system component
LAVVGALVAYYAIPIGLVIISLGEICPYSPSGISLCSESAPTKPGPRPVPRRSPALRALGKLAFAAPADNKRPPDIFVINADGTGLANLTRSEETDDRSPAWSPDGTEIAFGSDGGEAHARDIYVINVRNRALRNLTKGAGANYDPAWSPDGQKIAFSSERTDPETGEYDDHYEIYVRDRDGEVAKLTHNESDDLEPVWSPDGTMIAFISKRDGNWEIYAMNADGSAQRNLSNNPADDEQPAWSPDGRKIAFVSDRDDLAELYVMNPDGTAVQGLTNATTIPTGKSSPVWSRDSRKMAFINPPDQGIYLINADGSQGRKLLTGVDPNGGLAWQPSTDRRSTPTAAGRPAAAPRPSSPEGKLCKKPGIRFAGTTAQGAEVCFTLTPDRSKWVEIGFRFVRASRCPHTTGTTYTTGKTYYEGRDPLTRPGRITAPGFTATIHGARASGVLEDSETCKGKTFKWSARRAP